MSIDIQCPSCHARLRVADAALEWGACPRCLARIDLAKKDEGITAQAPTPSVAPEAEKLLCSECGDAVSPSWRRCPNCGGSLTAPGAVRTASAETDTRISSSSARTPPAETDVRRDTQSSSCLLVILAVVGGIGLAFFGNVALGAAMHGEFPPLIVLFIVLMFLGVISLGITMSRSSGEPAEVGLGRVVFGTLALAGGLIAVGFAILVLLIVACLAGGGLQIHP